MDPSLVQGTRKKRIKSEPEEENIEEVTEEEYACIQPKQKPSDLGCLPGPSNSSFSPMTLSETSSIFPSAAFDLPNMKVPSRHDSYVYQSSSAAGPSSIYQRPSVIMRAGREDPNKLQLQADILKFHGNILKHTGNLMSYHADLLHQEKNINQSYPERKTKSEPDTMSQDIKKEVKTEPDVANDSDPQDNFTDIADKIFEEAQDLLLNSPWILGFDDEGQSPDQPECQEIQEKQTHLLNWLSSEENSTLTEKDKCPTSVIQRK